MNEKAIILSSSIQRDITAIERIYQALDDHAAETGALAGIDEDALIAVAYYLHHLYNAFENIFQNIATLFENSVDEQGRWHAQLLERMNLNALPLRPQVIDDVAYSALNELRRFRHVFRHAYSVELDPDRLALVLRKAWILKPVYRQQLEKFQEFLGQMD
ncbi:MAG: hypothetical protein U0350_08630 [Caldilineaceae bacterium]